ncbi:MAG: type III pantothenate kinase [Crocinitomicaceae bacterium]|nr:type III pantothenate kinase [Crocinitomicaceae bacterium]
MNLIIDQGNTATKIGFFETDELVRKETFKKADTVKIVNWLKENNFSGASVIISSVVEDLLDVSELYPDNYLELTSAVAVPLTLKYKTPETLGKDRLANAVGAWKLNPGKNSLVIDLGTCVKYDLINADGNYLGGAISPGLSMRYQALNKFTDRLPLLEPVKESSDIGTDTNSSIHTGIRTGLIHEIKGFIDRYSLDFTDLTIFMTGGDLQYFDKAFKNPIFANPDLTLIGLNEILQHNIARN